MIPVLRSVLESALRDIIISPQYSREKLDHEETRAVYDVDVVHHVKDLTNSYVMCKSLIEHHDYHHVNMMSPMTNARL